MKQEPRGISPRYLRWICSRIDWLTSSPSWLRSSQLVFERNIEFIQEDDKNARTWNWACQKLRPTVPLRRQNEQFSPKIKDRCVCGYWMREKEKPIWGSGRLGGGATSKKKKEKKRANWLQAKRVHQIGTKGEICEIGSKFLDTFRLCCWSNNSKDENEIVPSYAWGRRQPKSITDRNDECVSCIIDVSSNNFNIW